MSFYLNIVIKALTLALEPVKMMMNFRQLGGGDL